MPENTADPLEQTIAASKAKLDAALEKEKNAAPPPPEAPEAAEVTDSGPEAAPGPEAAGIPVDMTEESVGDLIGGVFGTVALRYGEHWELQEFERNQLARAAKAVLDQYSVKMTPVTMLVFWAGMTIIPRIMMTNPKAATQEAEVVRVVSPEAAGKTAAPEAPPPPKEKTGWSADDKH